MRQFRGRLLRSLLLSGTALTVAATLALPGAPVLAADNLVTNGTFGSNGTPSTTGWTVGGTPQNSYDVSFAPTGSGGTYAFLTQDNQSFSQSITTIAGATYSVSLDILSWVSTSSYAFTLGGVQIGSGSAPGIVTIDYTNIGATVTAGSTSLRLFLAGVTGQTINIALSNVIVRCIANCSVATTTSSGSVDGSRPYFTLTDSAVSGSTITFNGGTLRLVGTTTSGQAMVIQTNGGTIDSNGNAVYLTGAVTGNGALTVSGTSGGEVHLNGLVLVPVTVGSTGTLRGTGLITGTTTVAGTLSPGNSPGTLTFLAPVAMQSGSTLALDIDGTGTGNGAGNYSRAIVTGGAFTAAGTLAPRLRGITYAAGEVQGSNSYTPDLGQKFAGVVQATGGVNGSFSGLTQPEGRRAGTRFDAVYNPASIDLYVTPASYGNLPAAGVGQTANQSAAGSALDAFRPAAGVRTSGDTKALFDALAPLDSAALPKALTQIAGEGNANLPRTAVDASRAFGTSISARLAQTRGSGVGAEAARDLISLRFGSTGGVQTGAAGPGVADSGLASGDEATGGWDKLSVWARGIGVFTDNRGDGNNPGFNRTIGGGLAGADLEVVPDLRVGGALGYARSDVRGGQSSGDATGDSYHAGLYAGWTPGSWFANADLGMTWTHFETRRDIRFGTLARTAKGTADGVGANLGLEAGRRFDVAGFTLEPSADLRYDLTTGGGYAESGAGILDLRVKDETRHAVRAGLGARASRAFVFEDGLKLEPELRARWEHDITGVSVGTSQTLNGAAVTVTAANPGRDAAILGAGFAATLDKNLKLYASYDAELRARQTDHVVTAGLRYTW